MEKLFLIFLGIRPFFENTLKNSHFALKNANFGVEISIKYQNMKYLKFLKEHRQVKVYQNSKSLLETKTHTNIIDTAVY